VIEKRVWIAQCLCPQRHCIVAQAGEAAGFAEAQRLVRAPLRRNVAQLLRGGALNGWCGICGAKRPTWRFEVARTRYTTMDEAQPELAEIEAANLLTNLLFGDTHRTTRPH
jgi:hypothetical protein